MVNIRVKMSFFLTTAAAIDTRIFHESTQTDEVNSFKYYFLSVSAPVQKLQSGMNVALNHL